MKYFLQPDLDYLKFVCGLACILLALATRWMKRVPDSSLQWKWLLLFGLTQGLREWLDLLAPGVGDTTGFSMLRLAVLGISFLFLLEFGRSGILSLQGKAPGRWIYLPLLLLACLGFFDGPDGLNASLRYVLGLTGSISEETVRNLNHLAWQRMS